MHYLFFRSFSSFIIADARRRLSSEIHHKPGPLQTIFKLPSDEATFFTSIKKYFFE